MDFGDKVKAMREIRGMSTTELAKLSGLSQSFISDIENKRRKTPTSKTIMKLAKALRVSPSYFFEQDVLTPFDVLNKIPEDIRSFMLELDNMPYMKISKKAKEEGITPEMLEGLLKIIKDAANRKNKS